MGLYNHQQATTFNPRDLAIVVWANTATKEQNHNIFQRDAVEVSKHDLVTFKPQIISNIVNKKNHTYFQRVAIDIEVSTHKLTIFNPQRNMSNIVWTFATTNQKNNFFFRELPLGYQSLIWNHSSCKSSSSATLHVHLQFQMWIIIPILTTSCHLLAPVFNRTTTSMMKTCGSITSEVYVEKRVTSLMLDFRQCY